MPDDPISRLPNPDPPEPTPDPPRARTSGRIRCEFCECELFPNGDVFKRGAEATRLQKLGEKCEKHEQTIADRDAEIVKLRARVAELESASKPHAIKW